MKYRRLIPVSLLIALAAVLVLVFRVGFPWHRALSLAMFVLSWVPLVISYRINRQYFRRQRAKVRRKTRPLVPHAIVALLLLAIAYVAWVLVPVSVDTELVGMSDTEIRALLTTDLESCFSLNRSVATLLDEADERGLLTLRVDRISPAERRGIQQRWRDGVMAFYEYELIKGTYRGFHHIDYVTRPELHADAFFTAYAAFLGQYSTCLRFTEMVGSNVFMETLLNEPSDGVPPHTYALMKRRLTQPDVLLRFNAGNAYYGLVKKSISVEAALMDEVEAQRRAIYQHLGRHPELFVDNPLDFLESVSFKAWYPLQKTVALQMSRIRTTERDYFITPEVLAGHREGLQPGDIMVQRRNWHMTNIGIPGFWPHAALYVGTPEEIDAHFSGLSFPDAATPSEVMRARSPEAYRALDSRDDAGHPHRVIEAIRPGVVFQSLEKSAHCDYLGVIRPRLEPGQRFEALLEAFRHHGKGYDFNFDFSTDGAMVCSELIYKAYQPYDELGLEPRLVSGRLLLPPNLLVELYDQGQNDERPAFDFVLFLDANEAEQTVSAADHATFRSSWARPKWDILQE